MESILSLFDLTSAGLSTADFVLRIGCAFAAGFVMGIEREIHQHPAGLRTIIMITVSSALMMILSICVPAAAGGGDPSRIAAQVVSGIGFLGGGAILRQGLNIRGLTSAAIIWASAAMGLALGAGFFVPAGIALTVYIITLILLEKLETRIFPAEQRKILEIEFALGEPDIPALRAMLTETGVTVYNIDAARNYTAGTTKLLFGVEISKKLDFNTLTKHLSSASNIPITAVNLHG